MDVIYHKPAHIIVSHEPKLNYIHFDWSNFYVTREEIEELHRAALAYARARRTVYYVANTSKVQNALRQDVVQWWGEEWVPVLTEYGLRGIFTVVPRAALAQFSTRRWQGHASQQGIEMVDVGSLAAAEGMIRERQGARP